MGGVKKVAGKAIDFTKMILNGILGAFGKLRIMLISGLIALGVLIWAWVQTKFGGDWKKFFKWIWDKLLAAVIWLGKMTLKLVGMLADWLGPLLSKMWKKIGQWFADIGKKFWNLITSFWKGLWNKISSFFKNTFNSIWGTIKGFFSKIVNGIKNLFNPRKLLDGLPNVVKKFIPGFETGGKITGGPETGDRILIRANAGEYIFNKAQMDKLSELLSKRYPNLKERRLTHEEIFKLANNENILSQVKPLKKSKGLQKFENGGMVLPEQKNVKSEFLSYSSLIKNINDSSDKINGASLNLTDSSNLLMTNIKNSMAIADNKTSNNANSIIDDKLNKIIQTNNDNVKINSKNNLRGETKKTSSNISKSIIDSSHANAITQGILEWRNINKEASNLIKTEKASLLNDSLKIKESMTNNVKGLKITKAQEQNQNSHPISIINARKNEVILEKINAEKQKIEAAKNADEKKYEDLIPIISQAIGIYFNSHSFRLEKNELKMIPAQNNAASRL